MVSSVMDILTRHIKRVHDKKLNVINVTRILLDNDHMVPEIYQTSNYIYYSFNYQYQVEYLLV